MACLLVIGCILATVPINCHVRALFINGHGLASNSHVHERDVVATRLLRQHGELSLASSTGNTDM